MRTEQSARMCQYWLANRYDLSADALAELLRSDAGYQILEAIMGEAKPVWWKGFRRTMKASALRKAHEEHRKKLEQFELDL